MDEGLSWWNEEFWITVVINFTSVAVTIGLTVLISWRLLNKQLQHERESQAKARAEDQADFERDRAIDRRIRFTGDLAEVLGRYAGRIEGAANNVRVNPNNNTARYYSGAVSENKWEVSSHAYRRAKSETMHSALTKIEMQVVTFLQIAEDFTRLHDQDDIRENHRDFMERWAACGLAISREVRFITEHMSDWQETDSVPSREVGRIDSELAEMQRAIPG